MTSPDEPTDVDHVVEDVDVAVLVRFPTAPRFQAHTGYFINLASAIFRFTDAHGLVMVMLRGHRVNEDGSHPAEALSDLYLSAACLDDADEGSTWLRDVWRSVERRWPVASFRDV